MTVDKDKGSTVTTVSADTAPNVYIGDWLNNRVVEVPAGGGAQTTVGSGLSTPEGVAVSQPPAASTFGALVTLEATVETPLGQTGGPTGKVTFTLGKTVLGTATLAGGLPDTATLTTSALPVGRDYVIATYGGDGNYLRSTAKLVLTVRKAG